jgi:hypothetical protein
VEEHGIPELEDHPQLQKMSQGDLKAYKDYYRKELNKGIRNLYLVRENLFEVQLKEDMQNDHDGKGAVKGKRANYHPKVRRSITPMNQIPIEPFLEDWNQYTKLTKSKVEL